MGHFTTRAQLRAYVFNLGAIIETLGLILARLREYPNAFGESDNFNPPLTEPDELVRRERIASYCYAIFKELCLKPNRDGADLPSGAPTDPGTYVPAPRHYKDQNDQIAYFGRCLRSEGLRKLSHRQRVSLFRAAVTPSRAMVPENVEFLGYIGQLSTCASGLTSVKGKPQPPMPPVDPGDPDTVELEKALYKLHGILLNRVLR